MNKENLQLRRLGADDIVNAFDCGDEDLTLPFYYKQGFTPLSKEDESGPTRLLYFDLESMNRF